MRSAGLFFLMFCSILVRGQLHSVNIFPKDTAICKGNSVKIESIVSKGSFRYIGTWSGKDYFMDTISRSWTDGRKAAIENGLDLWVIDSLQENNAVYDFIPYRARVDVMFWFGLYQDPELEAVGSASDGWKWIDGRALDTTFKYWYTNEPDNAFQIKFPANKAALGLNVLNARWGDMTDTLPPGYAGYAIAEADTKILKYKWTGVQSSASAVTVSPNVTTTYSLEVTYGSEIVTSSTKTIVVYIPSATANFNVESASDTCLKTNRVVLTNTTISSNPLKTSFLWDFGDGNTSDVNSLTYSYSFPQAFDVKLKATDSNGCFTLIKKTVTILKSPSLPVISYPTGKNVFCQGDSVVLNSTTPQDPALGVILKWYRGIDSVFTGVPYSAKISGNYQLIAVASNGCKDTAKVTITVNSLPRKPLIAFSPGFTGIICSIDTTSLTAQSPDPAFRYLWYKTVNGVPALQVQTALNRNTVNGATSLLNVPVTEYFQVKVQDLNNCISASSDSIAVITRPSPTSSISTNGRSSTFCDGDSVRLWGTSTPSGNTFSWTKDFITIPGTDSVYLVKTSGVYRMVATNSFGCSRTSNPIGVFVNKYPSVATILLDQNIADLTTDGVASICNGSSTSLRINPVSSATYQWFKDNAIITNAKSTSLSVNQAGVYKVAVTLNNCTTNSVDQKVAVRLPPAGELNVPSNTIICNGFDLRIDAAKSVKYQWYQNNVRLVGAVDSFYLATTPGLYKAEFIDEKGCKRMSPNFVNLTLVEKPEPQFTNDLYCINTVSNFTNQSQTSKSGTVTYLWRFKNGMVDSSFNTKHTFPDSGQYRVSLTVTPVACPNLADSMVSIINVQSPAKGVKYTPINAEIGKPIGMIARGIGDLFQWKPTTGLNSPFIRIPILTPTTEQLYTVAITNRAGCITTDSILVRIFDEPDIFVAGAFTPNRDGKNDRIYPILVSIDVFNYLKIYNRWGTLVYSSSSIDPEKGWDGTYKGNILPAETYTWVADAIGQDGKTVRRAGSIVLIR